MLSPTSHDHPVTLEFDVRALRSALDLLLRRQRRATSSRPVPQRSPRQPMRKSEP